MRQLSLAVTVILVAGMLGFCLFGPPVSRRTVEGGQAQSAVGPLVSLDRVDHSTWGRLLAEYVDRQGMVDYTAWKRTPDDVAALGDYLAQLSRGDPQAKTSPEGRLAFWINAYNALTVHGILKEYPTDSIRNHTAVVLGYNIWHDLLLPVGGDSYSLDRMEHKILRKLAEPRIHFAIVCASIGCPPLRSEAYVADRLESQLADNTRIFFSRPKHFRTDPGQRIVYVSPILKWFREDFGQTPQQGLTRLSAYLPDEAARQLVSRADFTVRYLPYDWGLNDQKTETQR